jgi:hypothetical protein
MPHFALPLFVLFMSYYFLTCLYWALYVVNDYIEMASCKTVVLRRTDRRTDGSVTISLCNFTGEGIINQEVNLIPMLQRSTYGLNTKV